VAVPISDFLSQMWDEKLYNWYVWLVTAADSDGGSGGVSSIYDPGKWRRGTARTSGFAVLSGPAKDTDDLLVAIRQSTKEGGDRVYDAMVEWVKDDGTRGAQAARLSMHQDTYRDIVDSGWLERLEWERKGRKIKGPRV
ncbi:MAG: hypothetical protein ABI624_20390, partial [Casimicrobiaceae bacterium]